MTWGKHVHGPAQCHFVTPCTPDPGQMAALYHQPRIWSSSSAQLLLFQPHTTLSHSSWQAVSHCYMSVRTLFTAAQSAVSSTVQTPARLQGSFTVTLGGPGGPSLGCTDNVLSWCPGPHSFNGLPTLYSNHCFTFVPPPLDRKFLKLKAGIFTIVFSVPGT